MRSHFGITTVVVVSVALALLAAAGGASAAELLTNGSLDQTYQQEVTPGFFLPKPAGWVNVGTRAISGPYEDELSSEPWAGPAPTPVTLPADMGVFFKGFSGNTTPNGPATAHLYQDIPSTPGLRYVLTGWAGAEANFLGGATMALDFLDASGTQVLTSELNLRDNGLFVANGAPFNYKQYTVTALAPSNAATVRARVSMIDARANPAGGGQAFVVDDFSLVPEPTFLSLAAPAGLLLLRRRRRAHRG